MIKVLIVDDEALVRIGIKTIIPWEELGLELIGEAENGKKALEIAREHVPDIILTDIKMPIMTGIELLKILKQENHPAKFIILSAHDDLEFVKEAMKNGAEDYILKLELEVEQIIRILKDLKEMILTAASSKKVYTVGAAAMPASHAPLHKEKLFKDMLLGVVKTREEIFGQLKVNRITFPEQQLVCLIVQVDDDLIYQKYGESPHLLDYSVLNILEEVLSSYAYGHVVSLQLGQFIAALSLRKQEEKSYEGLEELTGNIRTTLRKYLSTSVSIGISEIHNGYEHIQQAYREAKEAIRFAFIYPRGTNIYYRDICSISSQETNDLSAEMKSIEKAFTDGDIADIKQALELLTVEINGNNRLTKEILMGISFTIFYLFQSFVENYQLTEKGILTRDMYDNISKMSMKVDFIDWINQLKTRMTSHLIENHESMRVYLTKQFINKNYKDELSLEKVAEYLQLSSSYLSNLFKKETGQNFIDYVTEVRIGRAKFLLKTTDCKISEIAREVGYGDEYYFSKVFKKNVGESPLKYR
ncbi:response regulator [Paenibacillus monticola]|uniref:Response regulator n=1 Tax=Paenibacillus monticola TaxID=2666075 RepID=A0A7X2H5H4_9BACL|nr:response regulator [Paenibacillus monticola]MRN53810.1 response regulator [Paenibacillus monticola]